MMLCLSQYCLSITIYILFVNELVSLSGFVNRMVKNPRLSVYIPLHVICKDINNLIGYQ